MNGRMKEKWIEEWKYERKNELKNEWMNVLMNDQNVEMKGRALREIAEQKLSKLVQREFIVGCRPNLIESNRQ